MTVIPVSIRFKMPDLSGFQTATPAEKAMAQRFTRIARIAVEDHPDAHTFWLVVGNQQFRLDGFGETESEAAWTCWMLAKALLAAFVQEAQP